MLDNTAGDITMMKSAWEGLNIAVLSTNGGALRDFIQNITGLIGRVTHWIKLNPELAGQILKFTAITAGTLVTVGGLLLLLAPLMVAFKGLFTVIGFGKAIIALLGKGVWFLAYKGIALILGSIVKWTAAQVGLNIAMAANPLGLIIIAIAAVVAGFVGLIAYWDEVKAFFGGIGDLIEGVWSKIAGFIETVSTISSIFGDMWNAVSGGGKYDVIASEDAAMAQSMIAKPINTTARSAPITDNSQVNMTLNVHGGNPEEVRKVVQTELDAHQRALESRRRAAFGTG